MDAARLARAVHLTAEPDGAGRYRVTGGAAPHVVTLAADGSLACDCTDATVRVGIECKHVLKVRLTRADPDVLEALRDVVAMPTKTLRKTKAR